MHNKIQIHKYYRGVIVLILSVFAAVNPYANDARAAGATLKDVNFDGVNQAGACGDCVPPDTHGAVGAIQFVQVVNEQMLVYDKAPVPPSSAPALLRSDLLSVLFAYTNQGLSDPRVLYDAAYDRWIITAEAFPESPTVQRQFIAVSATGDATGVFNVYDINVNIFGNSYFWDFPQLGLSEKAIIITANIFPSLGSRGSPLYSGLLSIDKVSLYAGTLSYVNFTGITAPSLAPPIVIGSNVNTYLISAAPNSDALKLYTLQDAGTPYALLTGPDLIPVTAYVTPPYAPQPGTGAVLDASDNRFVNASVQKGAGLWQIHTIGNGGYITPKFYLIDLVQKNVAWTHLYFASPTSNDFNASIAGGVGNGDIFVSWTSTDPAGNIQAQARFAGTDSLGPQAFNGTSAYTSSTFYVPRDGRWGDYSAITVDPSDTSRAWGTNETVDSQSTWGSRIFKIGIP